MSIIDHIQYLISRHDCVVVTGLGAFVAQYESARLSSDGLTLLPPCRSLVFNGAVSHDDGLLVGSVARREGVSYENARSMVVQEVEFLLRRIDMEGSVAIPRVGRLERNGDAKSPIFIPDLGQGAIVNAMYAALPRLTVAAAVEESDATILEVDTLSRGQRIMRAIKPVARYAAAVALLLAVGATLSTPSLVERRVIDQASLSIPEVKPAKTIVVETPIVKTESSVNVPSVVAPVKKSPRVLLVSNLESSYNEADYNCFVIVASFTNRMEAERFVALNGGKDNMKILKRDGRYRVYNAVSNDYDAAYAYKSNNPQILVSHPQAWVYASK